MAAYRMVMLLSIIIFLQFHPIYSLSLCNNPMISTKMQNFTKCMALPTLNAVLRWTYDAPKSTLSMAFTAPSKDGWASWGLNPTGSGMIGAQALMAYQPKPTGPMMVGTVAISGYDNVNLGPISYIVTDLSGEKNKDEITIFGTWFLPEGDSSMVSIVWQVGPLGSGHQPDVHDMLPDNLNSKAKINLANGVLVDSITNGPIMAPWTLDSATKKGGAVRGVVSNLCVLGALLVYLF